MPETDPLVRLSDVSRGSLTEEQERFYREALERHHGERVAPVSSVCKAIGHYVTAITADGAGSPWGNGDGTDPITDWLRTNGRMVLTFATKSNLLYRLIYLGQPLRTKKCPKHDGHWSGCDFQGTCECQVGTDVTGWLPDA